MVPRFSANLIIFKRSIKLIQAVLGYWRDEVLTCCDNSKRRWAHLSSGVDDAEEGRR
jgi:hypothetical protein